MVRFYENVAAAIAIIFYVGTLFSLSLLTEVNIFLVFVGTLPILLYLIAFFYLIKIDPGMMLLWVLPLLFPIIFLFIYYTKTFALLNQIQMPTVTVINIVISYVINIFLLLIIGIARSEKPKREIVRVHHHELRKEIDGVKQELHHAKKELADAHTKLSETREQLALAKELVVNKDNFDVTLRGIEDKCKAINFVIGRVYSDKRGASQEIRDMLKIDPEWYNAFSEITADFKEEEEHKLKGVLHSTMDKLLQLEKKEEDLIKINIGKLPIFRKKGDTVLDVLSRNDKDPVMDYYKEAKEVCEKVLKYIDR